MQLDLLSISQEISLKDGSIKGALSLQLPSGAIIRAAISEEEYLVFYEELQKEFLEEAQNEPQESPQDDGIFEQESPQEPESFEPPQEPSEAPDEDGIMQI